MPDCLVWNGVAYASASRVKSGCNIRTEAEGLVQSPKGQPLEGGWPTKNQLAELGGSVCIEGDPGAGHERPLAADRSSGRLG